MSLTLDDLRRFTVARNFFKPLTLKAALERIGFVQADPIRSPARAQDLILRHRVRIIMPAIWNDATVPLGSRKTSSPLTVLSRVHSRR